jgi:DNA polymerase-3 subunit alpha
VTICVPDPETGEEIDLVLPKPVPVTPQVKGAIRAMHGVVMVEEL